jgi:hypothetical protein
VEWLISWGSGPGAAGRREPGRESPGQGPSAVAVAPDGSVLVLDRLNRRVLGLTAAGRPASVVAAVPADAEDLAAGAGGVLAVLSPLRARAFVYAGGAEAGSLAVPRELRELRGILLGPSHEVLAHSAYQDTYRLGSPAAPRPLASVLASRKKGEVQLDAGHGVAVQVKDGRAAVLVLAHGDRTTVAARHPLPGPALAARVIGAADGIACVRIEAADPSAPPPTFAVTRRVLCLRADDGTVVLARDLPPPGAYLPRREVSLGGSPPRLAVMHATEEGLRVTQVAVPTREVRP